jgi:hypothetical protein
MRPIRQQHEILPLIARPNDAPFNFAFLVSDGYDPGDVEKWVIEFQCRYGQAPRPEWMAEDNDETLVTVTDQTVTVTVPLDTVSQIEASETTLADLAALGSSAWSLTAYGVEDAFLWRLQEPVDFVDNFDLPADGTASIGSPITIRLGDASTFTVTILGNTEGGGSVDDAAIAVLVHAATEKTTLADDDEFGGSDSAASNGWKKWKWSTIRTAVTTLISTAISNAITALSLGTASQQATSAFATAAQGTAADAAKTKTDHLTVTQPVDLDAIETKVDGIEANATADQTNAEIRTAYETERTLMSQAEAEAGSETTVRLLNALRMKQAIDARIAEIIDSSPTTLDTLNELAAALGDDPNFASTMATALSGKQPIDATLTAFAALAGAANKLPYFSGDDTFALADFTAAARTLLAAADAAAQRTILNVADGATAFNPATPGAIGGTTPGEATFEGQVLLKSSALTGWVVNEFPTNGVFRFIKGAGPNYGITIFGDTTGSGGPGRIQLGASDHIVWGNNDSSHLGSIDTGVFRNSAGVLEINDGTLGSFRDIRLRNLTASAALKATPTTFASLTEAATAGDGAIQNITDGATTTLGAIATGGGSLKQTVRSDGTNWRVIFTPV